MCPETLLHTIFIERGEGNASRDLVLLLNTSTISPRQRYEAPFERAGDGARQRASAYAKDLV